MQGLCIILAAGACLALPAASVAGANHPAPKPQRPAPTTPAEPSCRDTALVPDAANVKRIRAATLCLVNQIRTGSGLGPLRTNRALTRSASRHARDMVARGFFDHSGPGGPGL